MASASDSAAEHDTKKSTGKECIICNTDQTKYKCPHCAARYCSLGCYKAHNTQCEEIQKKRELEKSTEESSSNDKQEQPNVLDNEDDEDDEYDDTKIRLKQEHYDKLKEDQSIRAALRDPRLQELITKIDTSEDRVEALQNARKANPHLREFIDKMLNCLGMIEWDDNGHAFFQAPRKG